MKATIFDIQRSSTVDGPGIRTTVFFKGCNLRCRWCHNPESQLKAPQMMLYKSKCIGCGKCAEVCPTHMQDCKLCGKCALYCPTDARSICGKEYTVDEVFDELIKDKTFYDNSGGGVTCSGGECMLQIDFLRELLEKCKEHGLHTVVDTAGNIPWESFESVLPYTDMFLYDMKCFSEDLHKEVTGVSNKLILSNLQRLAKEAKILIRIPVIPEVNVGELPKMAQFLKENGLNDVELLPYHKMGDGKYDALGIGFDSYTVPKKEDMEKYKELFK